MKYLKNTSWFTLVEMVIALTIFSIMSTAIISIYIQTTNMSNRLKATRYLSETAREITERIADDVRENGISRNYSRYDDGTLGNEVWKSPTYLSGGEMLTIGTETRVFRSYFYGKKDGATFSRCSEDEKLDTITQCGLYVMRASILSSPDSLYPRFDDAYNLVDSFIPEDARKRVKIEDLRFYISGDGNSTEKKVTLVFTLVLMPRIGVPLSGLALSKLHIQTTISERYFKKN